MMAKLAQTVSIYVVSIVVPVLVLSATRKEHPLTVLREIYTYVKTSALNGGGLAMRIIHKLPIPSFMHTFLTRWGLSPPSFTTNHTPIESTIPLSNTEEVETLPQPLSNHDEYGDLLHCTIALLRQGDDLSLAYREISYIPTFFAANPEALTIKRLDLTECNITCLENLQYFAHLDTLVLDRNHLTDLKSIRCPMLPSLTTLWCNNNDIHQVSTFLAHVTVLFPRLRYLNMKLNPAVPEEEDGEECGNMRQGSGLASEPGLASGSGLAAGQGQGLGIGTPRSPSSAVHTIYIPRSPSSISRGRFIPASGIASGIATPPTISSPSVSSYSTPGSSSHVSPTRSSHIRSNPIRSHQTSSLRSSATSTTSRSTTNTPTRPHQSSQSNLLPSSQTSQSNRSPSSQISQSNDRGHETLEDWSIADFAVFLDDHSPHPYSSDVDGGGFLTRWGEYVNMGEYVPSVSMPEMNMSMPEMSLPDMPSVSMPEMNMGEYVPSVSMPEMSLPDMPSVSMPTVSMPSVSMPEMSMPEMNMGEYVPSVSMPSVSMPSVSMPDMSDFSMSLPSLTLPDMPSVSMPEMSMSLPDMPSVSMPEMNMGEYVPSVSMPEMSLPDMPSVSMPTVSMPSVSMPEMSMPEMNMGEYVPSVTMPSVSMPDMSMTLPDMPTLSTSLSSYSLVPPSSTHPLQPPLPSSPSSLSRLPTLTTQQSMLLSVKLKKLSSRQQYRLAVIHLLPMLQILDFDEITMRERIIARYLTQQQVRSMLQIESSSSHLSSSSLNSSLGEDIGKGQGKRGQEGAVAGEGGGGIFVDEEWGWPDGFHPPEDFLSDPKKIVMMQQLQQEFRSLQPSGHYRIQALGTFWDINNKTLLRYLESSHWSDTGLHGVPIVEAILETIEFRYTFPLPPRTIHDRNRLVKGLRTGCVVTGGVDYMGRTILYLIFDRDTVHDFDNNFYALMYCFDRVIQSQAPPHHEFVMIVDCAGFGFSSIPPFATMKTWADIVGKHFSKRMGVVYMLNISFVVQLVYDMISFAISEYTRKKFRFLGSNKSEMRRVMGEVIDVSVLPTEYGGDGVLPTIDVESYLDEDQYLQHFLQGGKGAEKGGKREEGEVVDSTATTAITTAVVLSTTSATTTTTPVESATVTTASATMTTSEVISTATTNHHHHLNHQQDNDGVDNDDDDDDDDDDDADYVVINDLSFLSPSSSPSPLPSSLSSSSKSLNAIADDGTGGAAVTTTNNEVTSITATKTPTPTNTTAAAAVVTATTTSNTTPDTTTTITATTTTTTTTTTGANNNTTSVTSDNFLPVPGTDSNPPAVLTILTQPEENQQQQHNDESSNNNLHNNNNTTNDNIPINNDIVNNSNNNNTINPTVEVVGIQIPPSYS